MTFSRYQSYRQSGIEWLGLLPAHWEMKRLKYIGEAITGLTYNPSEIVDIGSGTLVLRSSNVQGGRIVFDDNVYVSTEIPKNLVTKVGDILICSRNGSRALIGKNALINEDAAGQTFGAFMTVFRSPDWDYLSFVFNSSLFEFQSGSFLTSTINQLTIGVLNNLVVPLPPEGERIRIAAFLRRETEKIDRLIAEQQRLMDLLKEKIISLALPPSELTGNRKCRLEHAAIKISRPVFQKAGEAYRPIGLYNRGRGLFHKDPREMSEMGDSDFFWIEDGDLIISGQFAWEGAIALAGPDENGCVVSHRYPVLRGKSGVALTEYLFAVLSTRHGDFLLNENSRGAAGRNRPLNIDSLLKETISVPDLETQNKVAQAVHRQVKLFREISAQIQLLEERRAALISAVVTGQISVCSFGHEKAA